MNREEMLNTIVGDIRSVCTNLMKFEEGCYIRFEDDDLVFRIEAFDGDDVYLRDIINRITFKRHRYVVFNTCEIIGKDPGLCDVLFWLSGKWDIFIDVQGAFYRRKDILGRGVKTEYVKWDFTKPLLKQQSDELIAFLWALCVSKKQEMCAERLKHKKTINREEYTKYLELANSRLLKACRAALGFIPEEEEVYKKIKEAIRNSESLK